MKTMTAPEDIYVINDAQGGYPCRSVKRILSAEEVAAFVRDGFMVRRDVFDAETLDGFRSALDALEARERSIIDPMYQGHSGSIYLRWLLTKDRRFFPFNRHPDLIAIARTMLGPQIKIDDADARITFPDVEDGIGWHIHLRCLPHPMPPFFCYPHAIHVLLYLDDVGEREGPLCVLPGSHHDPALRVAANSREDLPSQVQIQPKAGEVILIHGNLWHRAVESRRGGRKRRLMIGAFSPSWLRDEYQVGQRGDIDWRAEYQAENNQPEMTELLGGFRWA